MKKGGKQQQSHIYQIFIPVLFSKITKDDFLKINFKVFQNSSKKKKKKKKFLCIISYFTRGKKLHIIKIFSFMCPICVCLIINYRNLLNSFRVVFILQWKNDYKEETTKIRQGKSPQIFIRFLF